MYGVTGDAAIELSHSEDVVGVFSWLLFMSKHARVCEIVLFTEWRVETHEIVFATVLLTRASKSRNIVILSVWDRDSARMRPKFSKSRIKLFFRLAV